MTKFSVQALCITLALMAPGLTFADEFYAEITRVKTSKALFGPTYSINATIKSSDKNCDYYVNWWEAVSEDGVLLFRRVLGHPHSKEQPFTRGGPTKTIKKDTVFYVRAHVHPFGYSNKGMKGSVKTGFEPVDIPVGFAVNLASEGELPTGCDGFRD